MTKIQINDKMTKQELNEMNLDARAEFKMIDENTGMIGNYAIIKFYERDPQDLDDEKETAAEICERHTNEEIMQALVLMTYEKVDDFDRLPKYIDEFNRSLKSGEPMRFLPDATNEKELREYLKEERPYEDIDEHLKKYGDDYFYSPIGTIDLNRLY